MPRPARKRQRFTIVSALLSLAVPLLLSACSDSPSGTGGNETNPPESSIDLAQEFGGLTDTDEPANFDDPGFAEMSAAEAVSEPMGSDPRVQLLDAKPNRDVVFLRVVWGNLARNGSDSTGTSSTTAWDGSFSTTSGAILVQNLIRFEREDHIVRPRTNPKLLSFVSHTHGGVDGVLLRLVYNPDSTDAADEITFATGPLTVSFALQGIADLDSMIATDASGNGVAFTAVDDDRRGECAAGIVNGLWKTGLEDGGYLRAAWMTPNGFLAGVMRGRFGMGPGGHQVFVGKVIGPNGAFLGFVKGGYSVDPAGGQGDWRGLWFGRNRTVAIGSISGHWAARENDGAGFLHGRWERFCAGN